MQRWMLYFIIAGIFGILVIIQAMVHSKKPIKMAIISILIGVLSLIAVNLSSFFTGVIIPISFLTLGVSAVAGIPGVTMLLVLQMII